MCSSDLVQPGRQAPIPRAIAGQQSTGASPITVQGQIILLSPVTDPASGLRRVKLLFDNADGRVIPGVAGKLILE